MAAAVLLLSVFYCAGARAGFDVCNKAASEMSVALGRWLPGDRWASTGWVILAPGQCDTILSGRLTNRYSYIFAETRTGSWSGGSNAVDFCVRDTDFQDVIATGTCPAGFSVESFMEVETGDSDDFTLNLGETEAVQVATLQEKCLLRWDDSHQLHSAKAELTLSRQALKTTWKRLEHCVKLKVTGPIEIEAISKQIVDRCTNQALNRNRNVRIVETIAAIVVDVKGGGGAATAALLTNYAKQVSEDTISCLTDTEQLTDELRRIVREKFQATVEEESHWVYWDS